MKKKEGKKILIILGHPRSESFCGALATAYAEGADASSADVRMLELGKMKFDPILHAGYKKRQTLERDLAKAQDDLLWADHIVFVYPDWWGSMPALTKGFIERIFLPGFAYKYHKDAPHFEQYLTGKSARVIITMDEPEWIYRWYFGGPGYTIIRRNILQFTGIRPVRITGLGSLHTASRKKRGRWLRRIRRLGERMI